MIRKAELRIGNKLWIGIREHNIVTVAELYADEFKTPEEGIISYGHPALTGLLLSEDWLKRAEGFEKKGAYKWYCERLPAYLMTYPSGNTMVDVLYEIKYVHQLQNLYFSLTGEELTIK